MREFKHGITGESKAEPELPSAEAEPQGSTV